MKKLILGLLSIVVLVLVILSLTGVFTAGRISTKENAPALGKHFTGEEFAVKAQMVEEYYWGIGTVRSKTQSTVSGQVNGTVIQVFVKDGEHVSKGQVLIKIDDREYMTVMREAEKGYESAKIQAQQANQTLLQAQALFQQALAGKIMAEQGRAQAVQAYEAAKENFNRAEADFNRTSDLFKSGSAPQASLDSAKAAFVSARAGAEQAKISISTAEAAIKQATESIKAAEAGKNQANSGIENAKLGIERAEEIQERAKIALSYTQVVSPGDGLIGSAFVDPGDLVFPGKPLIDFYSRTGFEVLTYVSESLFEKVNIGDTYKVQIDSISFSATGVAREIIPSVDPMSRTFLLKVELEKNDRLFPGMFARVGIPIGKRPAFLVPKSAITTVGMLRTVLSKVGELGIITYVKAGNEDGDMIEIISGVSDGDIISAKGGR